MLTRLFDEEEFAQMVALVDRLTSPKVCSDRIPGIENALKSLFAHECGRLFAAVALRQNRQ